MRRFRVWLNFIVLLFPLCLLTIGAIRFVRRTFNYLNTGARLAGTLSAEATRALGREVRVRDVKITGNFWSLTSPNRIDLLGVEVAQGHSLAQGTLASAHKVMVWYNLRQLVLVKDRLVPFLNGLEVDSPTVHLLRDRLGHWNFEPLIKPSTAPGRQLTSKISISSGTIYYSDQLFPHPVGVRPRPLVTRFDDLNGVGLIRSDRSVALDLSGRGQPTLFKDFRLTGIVELPTLKVDARLIANQVALPTVGARVLPARTGVLTAGLANIDTSILYTPNPGVLSRAIDFNNLDGHGSLQLFHVAAAIPVLGRPLENTSGTLTFTTDSLVGSLAGRYAGVDLSLSGTVLGIVQQSGSPDRAHHNQVVAPTLSLKGAASKLSITQILRLPAVARLINRLSISARQELASLKGTGDVDFQISGTLGNTDAAITAKLASLSFQNYHADHIDASGIFSGHVLHAAVQGRFAKGDVAAHTTVDFTDPGAFKVEAHGRKLALDALGIPGRIPLSGAGDIDVAVTGQRGRTPNITAQVQVSRLNIYHQSIETAYAKADTVGRSLVLRTIRLEDPKGFALASGAIDLASQNVDVNLEADELDLGAVSKIFPHSTVRASLPGTTAVQSSPLSIAGIGYVRGKISGKLTSPILRGRLSAYAVQANSIDVDKVVADIDMTHDRIIISQGLAQQYPGQVRFSGIAANPFQGAPDLTITANVDRFEASDILRLAGIDTNKFNVTGSLSTDPILLEGKLDSLKVRHPFVVSLRGGSVNGLPLTNTFAEVQYSPEGLVIRQASVQAAGGTVQASGKVSRAGDLDLDLVGSKLDLEELSTAAPEAASPDVEGIGGFKAHISGTAKSPVVSGSLDVQKFLVSALTLGNLAVGLDYADQRVTAHDLTLDGATSAGTHGSQIKVPSAVYDLVSHSVRATATYNNFTTAGLIQLIQTDTFAETPVGQEVLATLHQITDSPAGGLSGTLSLTGTLKDPRADITWDMRNFSVYDYPINSLSGSAFATRKHVLIPSPSTPSRFVRIDSSNGTAEARDVDVEIGGNIRGSLRVDNFNIGILQTWFGPRISEAIKGVVGADIATGIGGTGNLIADVSGKSDSPVVDASLNLRGLAFAGQTLDRVDIDHIRVHEGSADIDGMRMVKKEVVGDKTVEYSADASGSVGFTWAAPFIPADAKLNFRTRIPDQPIQILSLAGPDLFRNSVGTVSLAVQVTGTRQAPRISGTAGIQAAKLQIGSVATGFQNVAGEFRFEGNRLTITPGFTAQSQVYRKGAALPKRTGTLFTLVGSIPLGFDGATDQAGIRLVASPGQTSPTVIQFDETPLPAINSGGARGLLQVNQLQITGSLTNPLILGDLTVTEAKATLPRDFGGIAGGPIFIPINPAFNVSVHLGKNVDLVSSQLNAKTRGTITLAGKLTAPRLDGHLALTEGRLTLPTARFTLVPPAAITISYPDPTAGIGDTAGLGLYVDLKARTSLTATSTSGVRKRYLVTVTARGPITGSATDPITGNPKLVLDFQTNPPDLAFGQQQLAQRLATALVGMDSFTQLQNPSQAFIGVLNTALTSTLLPGLFDRPAEALGFEELAINYDPVQRLTLSLTRHIGGPLYVSYLRSLNGARQVYDLKFSFRFRDRYQFSYDLDEQNTHRVLLEGVWRF